MKDLINYIKQSPIIKEIDIESKKISYQGINQNRKIEKLSGKENEISEELVRAYLLTKLVKELGYKPENIEIEKEYDIGRPKVNKPRIDVVVRDKDGKAFLYIELKSPQDYEKHKDEVIEKQLFNLASQEVGSGIAVKYLVLYSVELVGGEIKDKCLLIDYEKYSSFSDWEKTRDFIDQLPARYEKAVKEPYVKGGKKDLEKNFDHAKLDSKRKNLHNVLWGGGGTDDNDIFSSLVNIILAKIQDESEKEDGEKFDTTENKYIRLFIYKYFKVKAVVSLPQITFEPFTSTKTSLLFAQKKTAKEIEQWQKLWSKYSNEWSLLKTRCEKEVEHFIKEKPFNKSWAIASEDEPKRKANLHQLLKDYIEKDDKKLSLKALVEKYQDEITDLCKYDKDITDSFGFVNVWWVFGEVAKELNYKIFMAEVENVGYKRTKRGEKPMPNELYRSIEENGKEKILVDDGVLETALDHLRKVDWS